MTRRYQYGNVELRPRKRGPAIWQYRFTDAQGHRKAVMLGTIEQLANEAEAKKASEQWMLLANQEQQLRPVPFGAVIERYVKEELPPRYSTRMAYQSYLVHIRERWAAVPIEKVKPFLVREWLKGLALAPKSKSHIRNLMSILFRCAMLWEIIEVEENPMKLIRIAGASKRLEEPTVLTIEEFQHLLLKFEGVEPFRTMLVIAGCLGLRCSEIAGLKWLDVEWGDSAKLRVRRAVVAGHEDKVKTIYSRAPMPLDQAVAEMLYVWQAQSQFSAPGDWIFASSKMKGAKPLKLWGLQAKYLKSLGLGWHTFRHSYRSWLDETGAPMKVQQELMRHADIRTTMNIYGKAMEDSKREAHSSIVKKVMAARVGDAR